MMNEFNDICREIELYCDDSDNDDDGDDDDDDEDIYLMV